MLKPTEDWGKYLDDDLATNSRQDWFIYQNNKCKKFPSMTQGIM